MKLLKDQMLQYNPTTYLHNMRLLRHLVKERYFRLESISFTYIYSNRSL